MKKYIVTDIRQALEQIRKDLGEDAIILSTRSFRKGGFFGIGGKKFLEVTAVVDEKEEKKKEDLEVYKLQELLVKSKEKRYEEELTEIKQMLKEMKTMVLSIKREDLSEDLKALSKAFEIQDIDSEISNKILEYIRLSYGNLKVDETILEKLTDYFQPFLKTEIPILQGVVMFVGPTGVGKTTTLAKIAARLKLVEKKNVAILTLDTYRIAAAEQLKIYANIMDIPMRVAYTPMEAKIELEAMRSFDVVLIDTAGRSPNNEIQISELKALAETISPNICFLVLAMNYKYSDIKDMVKRFSVAKFSHVILTKMDETKSYGHLLNVPYTTGVPLAYVTNGQRVPEDIIEANRIELSHLLAKEVLRSVRSS
nr:flagellar biosynthesis protein FlhF [Pseudothermotoga thermarum]